MAGLVLAGCGTEPEPSAPTATLPAPSEGISRNEAVEAARDAASNMVADEWQVRAATAGLLGQVVPESEKYEWARDLPRDLRVWRVSFVSGDLSALVVTDFIDGRVYGVVVGIAN
jgi:hypothetical protein